MGHTRRAQILMDPDEYERLETIARQQGTSVAELFRRAVRKEYLSHDADVGWDTLCGLDLDADFGEPDDLARELSDAHG